MSDYERIAVSPKRARDWTAKWDQLRPIGDVNGQTREQLDRFCDRKRISFASLEALGTRLAVNRGRNCLAFAGKNNVGVVTAIKYRSVGGSSHDTEAEAPSVWFLPIILGDRGSLDWFVAEGETDAARIHHLVGDSAAILVLPTGARAFKREWSDLIPRGATVHLAYDADEEGDAGAAKAAKTIGGRTVRVRPPIEDGDWCDWPGDRDEFIALVATARQGSDRPFAEPLDEFVAKTVEMPEPLIGDDIYPLLPAHGLLIMFARGGKGKTTCTVDGCFHFASGLTWLGFKISRPLNILIIENEGPEAAFQQKLALKQKCWEHELTGRIHVATFDWGCITLKSSNQVARLRDHILDHKIDLVVGDPLDTLGLNGVGSPEDTREFIDKLKEAGLFRDVAFWLLAHARKEGASDELDEISGAWGGRPDSMLMLDKRDGNRARLSFPKIRWSRGGNHPAYILAFDPDTETFTVAHEESDEERNYAAEIAALLADGAWRTPKEISAKKDADTPGIGANVDTIKATLEKHPDRFVSRTGEAAKKVGRHPTSTVWNLSSKVTRTPESPESATGIPHSKVTELTSDFPYREVSSESAAPPLVTADPDSAESAESATPPDDFLNTPSALLDEEEVE